MINWKNERRRIDALKPSKYNPRKMSPKQKEDLKGSLEKFSLADPIIINVDGSIIGGHQRYSILKAQGVTEVDVRVPDVQLPEPIEKELNLRLNKNTGEFDEALLIENFEADMLAMAGFDGDVIDAMFDLQAAEDNYDVDSAAAAIVNPITVRGDVYEFPGGHRLMCGSATDYADVFKLMDGAKADLIYTDPPYNVNYKGKSGIKNDDQSEDDFKKFLTDAFSNAWIFSHDHANIYCWFAMTNYGMFRSAIESAHFKYMQVCFWLKERFVLSLGWYYHRATEPCMIFYKDWTKKMVNYKYAKNTEVWEMDRLTFEESLEIWYQHRDAAKDTEHPTQKPVRLAERAMKRNSEAGSIVLDLFAGGGVYAFMCASVGTSMLRYGAGSQIY